MPIPGFQPPIIHARVMGGWRQGGMSEEPLTK